MNVVAYIRVSTAGQADKHGLEAQREQVIRMTAERGPLIEVCSDVMTGNGKRVRPGLQRAIELCESGEADAIVVTKLDRLTRSVAEFGLLVERSRRNGWGLVIGDIGMDTSTPMGEAMAGMAVVFAQFERRRISERTKEGLAAAKAKGVVLGRRHIAEELRDRIRDMLAEGLTQVRVAEILNEEGVPTANGGALWRPSSFRRFL